MRRDEQGVTGPTRGQARGPGWVRCAPGLYVPVDRPDCPEQRVLEQATRLGPDGAVTGWASLRWQGAGWFDGRGRGGAGFEPVPLLVGSSRGLRAHPGSLTSAAALPDGERLVLAGVPVTTACRAVADEVVTRADPWEGATAISMAAAAGLVTSEEVRTYLARAAARRGGRRAQAVAARARDDLRSPREVWLHLVWEVVAGLPTALANLPVFGLDGTFLGTPDLLDVEAGLVAEYDGEHHRDPGRHRADVDREERLRDHGLEYVAVVRGHTRAVAAARLRAARARAAFEAPDRRRWTLEPPAWWQHR